MTEAVPVVIAFVAVILLVVAFWFGGAARATLFLRPGNTPRRTRVPDDRRDELPGNREVSP